MQLFQSYFDGDTPIRQYQEAASRGFPVPPFKLAGSNAEVFKELIESGAAAVTARRTYEIAGAWHGNGPLPGLPLFVVTHTIPEHCDPFSVGFAIAGFHLSLHALRFPMQPEGSESTRLWRLTPDYSLQTRMHHAIVQPQLRREADLNEA